MTIARRLRERKIGTMTRATSELQQSTHAAKRRIRRYTLEVNQRPVLAFSARSLRAAVARAREGWFIEELMKLRSAGKPIIAANDRLGVREAHPAEAAQLELELVADEARGEDTKHAFAFLVPVDRQPH